MKIAKHRTPWPAWFWLRVPWGVKFVPTDVPNPETGEPLWVWTKVRPRWFWWMCRARLFLQIVWRRWEDGRLGAKLAWEVAGILYRDRGASKRFKSRMKAEGADDD